MPEEENLCKELSKHQRAPLEIFTVKPWEKEHGKVSVFPPLSGVSGRDNKVETIKIAAEIWPFKFVLTLTYTPTVQYNAAYWM